MWPASDNVIAQADPKPPAPKAPPPAPKAPVPPAPKSPAAQPTLAGIRDLVDGQLKRAEDMVKHMQAPQEIKDKLEKRLAKVREHVNQRLSHLDMKDLDQVGDELDKMGDEIDKEMSGFGDDMDKWGQQFGRDMDKWGQDFGRSMDKWGQDFAKRMGGGSGVSIHIGGHDDDDDDKLASIPDVDDDDDLDQVVADLGDLSLKQPQRDQIQKLRADSDRQVATAKKALDQASDTLRKQLENPGASDVDIAKSIDAVTQQEAAIRKARILAWHNARRVLDDAQRKKVQDAVKAKTPKAP
jgi:hypothetical protein